MATLTNAEDRTFTDVYVLDYNTLNDADFADGDQITIATIPAGAAVELAAFDVVTDFVGATNNNLTFDVGTTVGDPDEFVDGLTASTGVQWNGGDGFTGNQSQPIPYTTSTSVLLEVNGSTGSTALYTAGKAVVGLRIIDLKAHA